MKNIFYPAIGDVQFTSPDVSYACKQRSQTTVCTHTYQWVLVETFTYARFFAAGL